MSESSTTARTHRGIAFFIPNLIGYSRFGALIGSLYFAMDDQRWYWFLFWYMVSMGLDAFDGKAARMFDQSSRYGAALDMVCDRAACSTMYMVLSIVIPTWSFAFFMCFLLDTGSHWLQFQSTAIMKSESHKGKN